jgi:hypothetical protein
VDAFDLRAIGRIVTRDACADILRRAFGAPRRMKPDVLRSLCTQWRALERLRSGDGALSQPGRLVPFGASLSPASSMVGDRQRSGLASLPDRQASRRSSKDATSNRLVARRRGWTRRFDDARRRALARRLRTARRI